MREVAQAAVEMLRRGESFALSTILSSSGSTPRGAGSTMMVRPDGTICGTVGGGRVEGAVCEASAEVIAQKKSRIMDFVLDGKDAAAEGVICGGTAKVLIDYIDAANADNTKYFDSLLACASTDARSIIVTLVPEDGQLRARNQCLIRPDGTLAGEEGFDPEVVEKMRKGQSSYDMFVRMERWQIYLHAIGTNGTVYVFGAGHCGEKLAKILSTVGFYTVVIDDREEFANEQRFPTADEIIVPESMEAPFESTQFNEESYIVIVTRGHQYDEVILRRALNTNAGYIGMLGSRAKRETVYSHLRADGFTQEQIDSVHSPIGLPIGGETPEEIAISITAELIQVRAARKSL